MAKRRPSPRRGSTRNRPVYDVRFAEGVDVLHAFQKIQIGHRDPKTRYRLDQGKVAKGRTCQRTIK